MPDIWSLTTAGLVPSVVIGVAAYLGKLLIERRLKHIDGRIDDMGKLTQQIRDTSLKVKAELRKEERQELVDFRVAVEKWDDFLQNAPFDFGSAPPEKADIGLLKQRDHDLFFDVKIALVKAATYLRDPQLEIRLMGTIIEIRKCYYPVINGALMGMIDLQAALLPIRQKLTNFEQSGMRDMTFAPTPKDRDDFLALQRRMTEEMAAFAQNFLKVYSAICPKLVELKEAINAYIYRPIKQAEVDSE